MSYPNHALATFSGTIPGAATGDQGEIFQFGVRVLGPEGGYVPDVQASLDDLADRVNDWFGAAEARMSAYAILQTVKLNNIAPDGRYRDPTTYRHDFNPVIGGGASYPPVPFCCIVWSWTTDVTRGLASHGRIYPPNVWSTNGGEAIDEANQNGNVQAAQAFLDVLAGRGTANALTPAVVSGVGAGAARPITGVRVGRRLDSQRRRKNAVTEDYHSDTWPA